MWCSSPSSAPRASSHSTSAVEPQGEIGHIYAYLHTMYDSLKEFWTYLDLFGLNRCPRPYSCGGLDCSRGRRSSRSTTTWPSASRASPPTHGSWRTTCATSASVALRPIRQPSSGALRCLNHRYVFDSAMNVGRLVAQVADKSQQKTQRPVTRAL